jgi:uncharacterized protein (TIGR02145 family)
MKKILLIISVVFASLISNGQMFYGHNQDNSRGGYGLLYNWYSASDANFAPTDWKVPEYTEFQLLITALDLSPGAKAKETGYTHWDSPNTDATNSSGFTGFGTGHRYTSGLFSLLKQYGYFWTTTSYNSTQSYGYILAYNSNAFTSATPYKYAGQAIRLIYIGVGTPTTVTDYDGNVYDVVLIGTQYWTVQNWKCTHLKDGTAIPEVTNSTTWAGLTTGAWCYYNNDPLNK